MMDPAAIEMESKMNELRARFLRKLQEHVDVLERILATCQNDALTAQDRIQLGKIAHLLSGTGTTYGFPTISEHARHLEYDLVDYPDIRGISLVHKLRTLVSECTNAIFHTPARSGSMSASASPISANQNHAPMPLLLIIDDDENICSMLHTLFRDDARVIIGTSGDEAIELMNRHNPDLVLLDNKLGGSISGLSILSNIQYMPRLKHIPVIMITASNSVEDVMRGLGAGAADYITKPFDPRELASKVRGHLMRNSHLILIADDDETVSALLSHKFETFGCKVACVADGNSAWDLLCKQKFSLVVLDRMMPGYDGMTLLRMMKHDASLVNVPVVFLTSRYQNSDVHEGLSMGSADYITKPFIPEDVVTRCLRLLAA